MTLRAMEQAVERLQRLIQEQERIETELNEFHERFVPSSVLCSPVQSAARRQGESRACAELVLEAMRAMMGVE